VVEEEKKKEGLKMNWIIATTPGFIILGIALRIWLQVRDQKRHETIERLKGEVIDEHPQVSDPPNDWYTPRAHRWKTLTIMLAAVLCGCGESWYDAHPPKHDPNCTPPCSESDSMTGPGNH
jgi:hypothetical protein